ncbi:YggT family protein [Idiomarina loihiensis]|uniref:YggT family protein n=1 Tax=Idiomarina loihiensis TaxID=135577 RepID=UPI00129CA6FE|nr:YggT family protein [Idiomarina loihiensis]MRJ44736.1 YggT family protein [Idiomarina loihiensis]UTW33305.1 YggT family protein [Idiomarina loihiensis]
MNNALTFLVATIIDLYLVIVLLRLWMQLTQADFYNPVSQFVYKATQPVVGPLRSFMPMLGKLDTASLILALALGMLKVAALVWLNNLVVDPLVIVIQGILTAVSSLLSMLFWVLVIRAILSWFSQGYNPVEAMLHQITEPLLAPVRKILPPIGGLDLSVLVVIIGLQFLRILIGV